MRTRLVELTVVNAPQAERIPRLEVDAPPSAGRLHPFDTEVFQIRWRIAKTVTIRPSAASAVDLECRPGLSSRSFAPTSAAVNIRNFLFSPNRIQLSAINLPHLFCQHRQPAVTSSNNAASQELRVIPAEKVE
ncbi:hypothetical protein ACQP0C_13325 [Nocardia sp. CA-129566]|uniref:hypothetical protein n=1 Tax=Nocardia sp. CA-129566 TaxID=3239976 RepID=UPI003D96B5A3